MVEILVVVLEWVNVCGGREDGDVCVWCFGVEDVHGLQEGVLDYFFCICMKLKPNKELDED